MALPGVAKLRARFRASADRRDVYALGVLLTLGLLTRVLLTLPLPLPLPLPIPPICIESLLMLLLPSVVSVLSVFIDVLNVVNVLCLFNVFLKVVSVL